jgi:hypothetical protein
MPLNSRQLAERTILTAIVALPLITAPVTLKAQSPAPDDPRLLVVQIENDSLISPKNTDSYYTSGLRLGFVSGTHDVPSFLTQFTNQLFGTGVQRFSIDLSQGIYTSFDRSESNPPQGDRPYAGVLMANFGLIHDKPESRTLLSLGLGVVGPYAGGQEIQNGWHQIIGATRANGWHTQLNNEPAFELTATRMWRPEPKLLQTAAGSLEFDMLPQLTAGAGNVRLYGLAGVTFRFGQGLDSDFGAPRMLPGLSGGNAYTLNNRSFAWYLFAGADVQAVAHDITLDGNTFVRGPEVPNASVRRIPGIAEFQWGFAILTKRVRFTFTNVLQTAEFVHQRNGLFNFSSISASVRF